jgi:hypothetical protein
LRQRRPSCVPQSFKPKPIHLWGIAPNLGAGNMQPELPRYKVSRPSVAIERFAAYAMKFLGQFVPFKV